jgi:Zn-dependent peptidase ImmA (M78 family)
MELEGQKEQITGLFDYVNDVLGLENPPNIEYYNEPEQGNYGGYNPATNTLSINEYMLYDSNEAADTVAHELWHAYQHERAANPQTPKDFQYQFGFDNYIRPGDDFDGYQSQLVEAEARAFADQFKGALAQIRST